jgi:hypothetical protein
LCARVCEGCAAVGLLVIGSSAGAVSKARSASKGNYSAWPEHRRAIRARGNDARLHQLVNVALQLVAHTAHSVATACSGDGRIP